MEKVCLLAVVFLNTGIPFFFYKKGRMLGQIKATMYNTNIIYVKLSNCLQLTAHAECNSLPVPGGT